MVMTSFPSDKCFKKCGSRGDLTAQFVTCIGDLATSVGGSLFSQFVPSVMNITRNNLANAKVTLILSGSLILQKKKGKG